MGRPRTISDDAVLAAAREAFVEYGLAAELFFAAMEPPSSGGTRSSAGARGSTTGTPGSGRWS